MKRFQGSLLHAYWLWVNSRFNRLQTEAANTTSVPVNHLKMVLPPYINVCKNFESLQELFGKFASLL